MKKTPSNHPDHVDLEKALELLRQTAGEINKKKGESMKILAANDLQQKVTNYPTQKLGDIANGERFVHFFHFIFFFFKKKMNN